MTRQYLDHCREILTSRDTLVKGGSKEVPVISLFGYMTKHDLRKGFPALTTKKMAFKSAIVETLWFMRGETNIKELVDHGVPIWTRDAFNHNLEGMIAERIFPEGLKKYTPGWLDVLADYELRIKEDEEFAARWGDLGPVYGAQWRNWQSVGPDGEVVHVDQFADVINSLKTKPMSKKIILNAWNAGDVSRMALPPCHLMFQTGSDGEVLDLMMTQRSCDQFLGVPFNDIQYGIVTEILARESGLTPRIFVHSFGDSHFYAGVNDRGNWYRVPENFAWLQGAVRSVREPSDYLNVKEDLENRLPPEVDSEGNVLEGKTSYDHVTAIIEQMSRDPLPLSRMEIADKPFYLLDYKDFRFADYKSHPAIHRAMAV